MNQTEPVTPAEPRDENTFIAPTLLGADVRISIVDEHILLRLDTEGDQTWYRLTRENFAGLAAYLTDEAARIKGH